MSRFFFFLLYGDQVQLQYIQEVCIVKEVNTCKLVSYFEWFCEGVYLYTIAKSTVFKLLSFLIVDKCIDPF